MIPNLLMYGTDSLSYLLVVLFTFIAVIIALVLHECAHGLVALWNGDYTAKYEGRLTLNPVKHFDLIGFVMMMLVGFGYAKPVPVNPYNFKHLRRGLITVSIAGICTNIILALFSALLYDLMILGMINATTEGAMEAFYYFSLFFSISLSINLSLAFFNLLPIFPLDGFRLVEALTYKGNAFCKFMRINGQYLLWGLVGLSFIISMAFRYVPTLPGWFTYFDVLGTYLDFFVGNVSWAFTKFWSLMIPGV